MWQFDVVNLGLKNTAIFTQIQYSNICIKDFSRLNFFFLANSDISSKFGNLSDPISLSISK